MPTSILWRKIKETLWFGRVENLKKRNSPAKRAFVESSMRQAEDVINEAQSAEYHRAPIQLAITPRSQFADGIDHQTCSQAVGNIVGEQHHRDRHKRGNQLRQIIEFDLRHRTKHQDAHGD